MPAKITDAEIMRAVLDALQTNAYALAKEIGASNSTIHQIISGRNKLSGDIILDIHEKYPQVSIPFMRSGNGDVLVSLQKQNPSDTSLSTIAQELTEIRKILKENSK